MKHFTIASIFSMLVLTCSADEDSRIVGGVEAQRGRYPYLVSLSDNGEAICGGSLIAPNYVLTAAHCAGYSYKAEIGRHNLSNNGEDYESISVIAEFIHPNYNDNTSENDFMVLKLASDSSYSLVTLDEGSAEVADGTDVTVMGWGATCEGGPSSDVLLEVEVDIVGHPRCNSAYGGNSITNDMLCAARDGKDACQGDSGGPLVIKGSSDEGDVQVGIVSWGLGCADPNFPGVYSRVATAMDFINTSMEARVSNLDTLKYRVKRTFKDNFRMQQRINN